MAGTFFSSAKKNRIGVDFLPTGVAVAEVTRTDKENTSVNRQEFLPASGMTRQVEALHQWVQQNKLQKSPCHCLMARHDVQLIQIEKPQVPAEELAQAVKWKIKDLIHYDVEQAVVDTFELPRSPKTPAEFINAVVASEAVVRQYVDAIRQAELDLQVLDVHELVTRNYWLSRQNEAANTAMILQLTDNESYITIYHQQDLYVSRDIKTGLLAVDAAQGQGEETYDAVLLEIQRSMDYFESSYGLGQTQKILVFPQTASTGRMARYLQNYLHADLEFIEISGGSDAGEDPINSHCFSAYCAALRGVAT